MRLTLAQLRKLAMPHSFSEVLDVSEDLKGFEDILDCGECKVDTIIKERGTDTYLCEFKISIDLVLEDSITLEPVSFPINVESSELFSNDEEYEDAYPIDNFTLDTRDAIVTDILSNKPMSFTNSEYEALEEDEEEKEEEYINPAFASLKDLLK